jgi:hypothetical protein
VECSTPVRRPGVVIINTLTFLLPLASRPSETRYIQTPIRFPMRTNLCFNVVIGVQTYCRAETSRITLST